MTRRLPIGADVVGQGVHFRVWAPGRSTVTVHIEGRDPVGLTATEAGYFAGLARDAAAGDRYRFSLDGGPPLPDPASRYQPDGPHGPSVVVDPSLYAWRDEAWSGPDLASLVVYEIHVGTFTPGGTWRSAAERLSTIAEIGITCLEIMPIADFAGQFGWGYDGVNLYAPTRLYGTPDDLRYFVDTAHALGLAVVLDVVYNHFGPDGCYLAQFAPAFFGPEPTEWGQAINYDGRDSEHVREYVIANARYWVDEFHVDGLRLDALQAIRDTSPTHIVTEIVAAVRQAAGARTSWVVGEHEPQQGQMLRRPDDGGFGLDALWNDDFHHCAMVAATGRREAYYTDYAGGPQEFVSAAKYGFLYQGQWYAWQEQPRGTPVLDMPPGAFVCFLQNHDQVANSTNGLRLHDLTSLATFRALTAVLLLGPWVPMLFQGQEYASDSPFLYFADHPDPLARAVRLGRQDFLAQFPSGADAGAVGVLPDPHDRATFERSILAPDSPGRSAAVRALHASLLQLRSSDMAFRSSHRRALDGAVLGPRAFVLRFFAPGDHDHSEDRLLLVNLGAQLDLTIMPEPLLAPPADLRWSLVWSSDDPLYGGPGVGPVVQRSGWRLQAESACVMAPSPARNGR